MSYDLMVFSKKRHFNRYDAFRRWYDEVTWWKKEVDYSDCHRTTNKLRQWFLAMKDIMPPSKGEFAPPKEDCPKDEHTANYFITHEIVYVECPWIKAEIFGSIALEKAQEFNLALYNATDDCVYYPDGTILTREKRLLKKEHVEYLKSIQSSSKTTAIEEQIGKIHREVIFPTIILLLLTVFACYELFAEHTRLYSFFLSYYRLFYALPLGAFAILWTLRNNWKVKTYIKQLDAEFASKTNISQDNFQRIHKQTFSEDVIKGMYDNVFMAFHERLGDPWFYVQYIDGWPSMFIIEEYGRYIILDREEFPEYQVVNDLVYAVESGIVDMIGTISEADFLRIKEKARHTSLAEELTGWLQSIDESENPADDICAIYIGIKQQKNEYTIYLIGSASYNEHSEWYHKEDFVPKAKCHTLTFSPYVIGGSTLQKYVATAVTQYIAIHPDSPLFKNRKIIVGLEDKMFVRVK